MCLPALTGIAVIPLLSRVTFLPSTFTYVAVLVTKVRVVSLDAVNSTEVELSNFKHWVKLKPLYSIVPLFLARLPVTV